MAEQAIDDEHDAALYEMESRSPRPKAAAHIDKERLVANIEELQNEAERLKNVESKLLEDLRLCHQAVTAGSSECLAAALAAEAAPEAALVCPSPASKEGIFRVDLDHDDCVEPLPTRPSRRALALGHFLRFAQLPASAICHPTFVHLAAEFDITVLMPSVAELDAAIGCPEHFRKAPTDGDRDDGHDRDRASVKPQPPASLLRKRGVAGCTECSQQHPRGDGKVGDDDTVVVATTTTAVAAGEYP
ncbi:hypothetical protein DFJ73DRAFT_787329 [Zopfochytrium polystomum]|nr:hypothetical protein DFJ73DRAFT_787329 [Zopfochytrium polystomum]